MEETEKEILFVRMALDDAREKGNNQFVIPALIKLGLLNFQLASQAPKEKDKEDALTEAEKRLNEALFESKKLRLNVEEDQLVLIHERLCSVAEHRGNYGEMAKQLQRLEKLATKIKDENCLRRTRNGLCFVKLKEKNWEDLFSLTTRQVDAYDTNKGWVPKDALRLFRYLADAVNHLPASDEVDATLAKIRRDKRFASIEGFKPVILRATCTSLKKRKKYKELCEVRPIPPHCANPTEHGVSMPWSSDFTTF